VADKRKPWMKWYTRDWRSNAKLRMCSYAARGLWADLISLMAEAEQFGFLMINGIVPTCKQLAGLLGGTEREVTKLRAELAAANVFSVTGFDMPADIKALIPQGVPDGVILSRRMVRDAAKAAEGSANGKLGGNPRLIGLDNVGVNPPANPQRSEVRDKSSEAKASGARAPARDVIFAEFLPWLNKRSGKDCRSLVGRWLSDTKDDDAVRMVMEACEQENPVDPVSWIAARFKPRETAADRRNRELDEVLGQPA
jgi:hypothetical protein